MKKTNLTAVKDVAKMLLYLDFDIDKQFPFLVHHPFFQQIHVFYPQKERIERFDVTKPEECSIVRDIISKEIDDAENFRSISNLIRVPYWAVFFKYVHMYLDASDYSNFLSILWRQMEFPNRDVNVRPYEFVRFFKKADKQILMEPDELSFYETLPDEIMIYRGISERGSIKALSWTLDMHKAEWFSQRFGKKSRVYRAKIRREDVLAYFAGRGESEVVVDYRKLYAIEKYNDEKMDDK